MKVPKFRGGSRGRVLVASGRVSWRKAECGRVVPKRPIVIAEWLIHHLGWNKSVLESRKEHIINRFGKSVNIEKIIRD